MSDRNESLAPEPDDVGSGAGGGIQTADPEVAELESRAAGRGGAGSRGTPPHLRAVEALLRREASGVEFFQAVRLLEKIRPDRAGVGRFIDPSEEVVRFSANPSISFPPAEIQELELPEDGPARMVVNFMGLIGPQGVLPYHYTLLAAERSKARDNALRDFFALFDHRIISLFYRAWAKHRFAVAHEEGEEDRLTEHLFDLIGLGTRSTRGLLPFPDEVLLFYAGLVALPQRSAVALEQILEDYFGVPVDVQQFIGGWYPLADHDLCRLDETEGAAGRLGLGATAGDEVWDQQMRVRIRLGPLTRAQFDDFLPTGSAHEPLRALTRFFAHDQFSFEVQLVLQRDEVPGFVVGGDGDLQLLGWSTWIRSAPFQRDADDTIFSL